MLIADKGHQISRNSIRLDFLLLVFSTVFLTVSMPLSDFRPSLIGFVFSMAAGLFIFVKIFHDIHTNFKLLSVLAAISLISTAGGTLIAFIFVQSEGWDRMLYVIGINSYSSVIKAQLLVNLYSFVILLLGGSFKARPLLPGKKSFNSLRGINDLILHVNDSKKVRNTLFTFSVVIISIQLIVMSKGWISALSEGLIAVESGRLSVSLRLLFVCISPTIFSLGIICGNLWQKRKASNPVHILLLVGALFIEIIWFLNLGERRSMMYGIIIFLIGVRFSVGDKVWNSAKLCYMLTIIFLLLIAGFSVSSFVRFSMVESEVTFSKIPNILEEYLMMHVTPNEYEELRKRYTDFLIENVSDRIFVLNSFARVVESFHTGRALLGKELVSNVTMAIPYAIYPNKDDYIIGDNAVHTYFDISAKYSITHEGVFSNIETEDLSDSYYLSGFIDFHWLGMIIIPLFLWILFSLTMRIALMTRSYTCLVYITGILIDAVLMGAEGRLLHAIIACRESFLLIILFTLLRVR